MAAPRVAFRFAKCDLFAVGRLGLRLNTYADSIEPARVLGLCPPDLNRLARAAIPRKRLRLTRLRPGPETLCSTPTRDPFKLKTAVPSGRGSSFLRTCVWGGCAKIVSSFSSDVFARSTSRGRLPSLTARAPGGRTPRGLDRWRPRPIKSPDSSRTQHRPGGLEHHCVWSVTRKGIGD